MNLKVAECSHLHVCRKGRNTFFYFKIYKNSDCLFFLVPNVNILFLSITS